MEPESLIPDAVERKSLRVPGPREVLTHGDPTPANAFLADDGEVLLLDVETSAPRHAMVDGAFANLRYLHSVWARALPESLLHAILAVRWSESALELKPYPALAGE